MANSTDEAVVVERGRAGIILQFSDGDEERYDEDDVELLAPTGDGLERAIPRTPRAPVREVVPVAQRIPPQKENARRAYAIAKHRVVLCTYWSLATDILGRWMRSRLTERLSKPLWLTRNLRN